MVWRVCKKIKVMANEPHAKRKKGDGKLVWSEFVTKTPVASRKGNQIVRQSLTVTTHYSLWFCPGATYIVEKKNGQEWEETGDVAGTKVVSRSVGCRPCCELYC